MNILLLSQFFSTTKGGGEYVYRTIADSLTNNDNNVWVITNKVENEKYEEKENLRIISVKPELEYNGGIPTSFFNNLQVFLTLPDT